MIKQKSLHWKDYFFLFMAALFFFGCIASTHRSPKTLEPGQFSFSGSYLQADNIDNSDAESIRLIALDGRAGLARGVDIGIMHTWDISKDNENAYATIWGDCKVQLSNKDNLIGQPIFSIGLMKGYVNEAELHISTFPLMLGIPMDEYLTPYFIYRFEVISEDFISNNFEDPRHTFALGLEINLRKPDPHKFTPKLGLSVGTYNSLLGGEGDQGLILNLGLTIDTSIK